MDNDTITAKTAHVCDENCHGEQRVKRMLLLSGVFAGVAVLAAVALALLTIRLWGVLW